MELRRYELIYKNEMCHWWYQGRQRLLSQLLATLHFAPSVKILDFGCGTGLTLSRLNRFGNPYGVDKEKSAIDYCRRRGLTRVKIATHNKIPYTDNFFSVCTCLDVLEHIKDDAGALREITRVLKRNGYLILFVPAYPFLWGKLDIISHHLRRYTRKDLCTKINETGFTIKEISYFNSFLFVAILMVRLFQKTALGRRFDWGIHPTSPSKLLNWCLKLIFSVEVMLLRWFQLPFGVSLYVVAQKNIV